MKKICLLFIIYLNLSLCQAQGVSLHPISVLKKEKGKSVKYNSLGMGVYPYEHLMIGGNHVSYRKFGFGISWRTSFQNIQFNRNYLRDNTIDINLDTAKAKGWLTGDNKTLYSFSGNINFVFPITKKIPMYIGIGATRQRQFIEVQAPFSAPGDSDWLVNLEETKFRLNFGGGIFIPIAGRLVLNLGYDHQPQTIFVGFAISGPFNYEDLDMW
jgi:hypothetical protein